MQKESFENEKKGGKEILVFCLADEELGVDISSVREVLRPPKICPLPKTPQSVEGVIHLRGHIIALIDLRKRLLAGRTVDESNKRIIVCKVKKYTVGLTVNSIREIIALSKEDIEPTPEVVAMQMEADVISGIAKVGERIIPILNLEHILSRKEEAELSTLEK
jgi:purine-binding chemotaxis protein CheW